MDYIHWFYQLHPDYQKLLHQVDLAKEALQQQSRKRLRRIKEKQMEQVILELMLDLQISKGMHKELMILKSEQI
jgi:ribulose kinase